MDVAVHHFFLQDRGVKNIPEGIMIELFKYLCCGRRLPWPVLSKKEEVNNITT
ncbi:hypothetical protein [Porphyromonas loveana]|uniref:hypothetical protein n=1 Tax=Porphyromonas loveana TaxID=1884669 RepID=UPI001402B5C8|nr:hypothetical protein [Porphyromonas loveana]